MKGVGEARAGLLEKAGVRTVRDLLYFFPFRYEDRTRIARIADLRSIDQPVTLRGRIVSASLKVTPVRKLKIFEAILDDGTGRVMLVWFNQPYLADQLQRDDQLVIYGQPRLSNYGGRLQFESPDFEKLDTRGEGEEESGIIPVYSAISGIAPKTVRRLTAQALYAIPALADPLPEDVRMQLGVIPLADALVRLHRPASIDDEFVAGRSPAHRRLILEEFFSFQLALRLRRAADEQTPKGRSIRVDNELKRRVREILPFHLTPAQKRVVREIAGDMRSEKPMYRLLQGDVGSGKTIVALIAAMVAIENGHQVALLAPTEILAEQHFERIRQLVGNHGVRIEKLSGSVKGAARRTILKDVKDGEVHLTVGTHAIIEDPVQFHSLGLAIVDEQHRFGVEQRRRLFAKGEMPDILVMTATPIPRSLALSVYGDLDVSVIDELPPGRVPVKTVVRGSAQLPKVLAFVETELAAAAQAYIVYPIIDESETLDLTPLVTGFDSVRASLPGRRVEMLHGRMAPDEKDAIMQRFKRKETDVLVSTTVIEVGIDVPNASVMVIEGADRFGLSQLHQLRGRVGRGERKSWCVLVRSERSTEEAKARLRTFEATRDGFEVAERDLELRGAGDFLGTRQAGSAHFRFGDILRDHRMMEHARRVALDLVASRGVAAAGELVARLLGSDDASIDRD